MPKNRANCAATGKRRYHSEAQARAKLQNAMVDYLTNRMHYQLRDAYLCRLCNAWHLTKHAPYSP